MTSITPMAPEEVERVLAEEQRRGPGRPPANERHPLGFLRAVRDRLGPPPYDPEALLELAENEPGWGPVLRHPALDHQLLVDKALRSYAADACAEIMDVTYREDGKWLYDEPESAPLDKLFDHLRLRAITDETRGENFARLHDVAEQRAVAAGSSYDAMMAESRSRYNDQRDLVAVEAEAESE